MRSGRLYGKDLTEGCLSAAGRGPKDRVRGLGVWERSVEIGQEDESLGTNAMLFRATRSKAQTCASAPDWVERTRRPASKVSTDARPRRSRARRRAGVVGLRGSSAPRPRRAPTAGSSRNPNSPQRSRLHRRPRISVRSSRPISCRTMWFGSGIPRPSDALCCLECGYETDFDPTVQARLVVRFTCCSSTTVRSLATRKLSRVRTSVQRTQSAWRRSSLLKRSPIHCFAARTSRARAS